jgi:pimeloyl-ACP methyl ester carboxylesterase
MPCAASAPDRSTGASLLRLPSGVFLRVIRVASSKGTAEPGCPSIVLVPGLASVPETFVGVVAELAKTREVFYIETREKASSSAAPGESFAVDTMADDLAEAVGALGLYGRDYVMVGYSLGAAVALEGIKRYATEPRALVLVEPNGVFAFPVWLRALARWAVPLYGPLVPILKWYARTFRVDMEKDPELYAIICRILDAADPAKLAAAVLAASRYRLDLAPGAIRIPTLVVAAPVDSMHGADEARRIAGLIPGSRLVDAPGNRDSHGPWMGRIINDFVSRRTNGSR